MAEWTNLPDQEPGDPGLASWANGVRDNPVAIAQGASGAPRIETNGINNSAVTTAKISNNNVTQAKLSSSSVGRSQLRTSTNSTSGGLSSLIINMDAYSFFPGLAADEGVSNTNLAPLDSSSASADSPGLAISGSFGTNKAAAWRFVTS